MTSQQKSVLALILLFAATFLGNYFALPLFFGVDFLFGSIAVLLILRLYGLRWGLLAALVASGYTYFAWNHPYGGIIFFLEALFVGLLCRRYRPHLVLLDGIYWLLIGLPLVWLFYRGILRIDEIGASVILLKQPVNGLFNALVANLILTHFPLPNWVGKPQKRYTLSLQQTLFNLLVAFVFFPVLLLMALDAWQTVNGTEAIIELNLKVTASEIATNLSQRQHLRIDTLKGLGQIAQANNMQSSPALQQSIQLIQQALPSFRRVSILDRSDRLIATSPSLPENSVNLSCPANTLEPQISEGILAQSQPSFITSVPIIGGSPPNVQFLGCAIGEIDLIAFQQVFPPRTIEGGLDVILLDRYKHVLLSTDSDYQLLEFFEPHDWSKMRSLNSDNIYQWFPSDRNIPALTRWQQSVYFLTYTFDRNLPWTLAIRVPATTYITDLQKQYIKNLAILLLVTALAFYFAAVVNQWLVNPLSDLAHVTTNLPDKLLSRAHDSEQHPATIIWPRSPSVREIDTLIHNVQLMAATLYQKLQEIHRARETLEQRVFERTQELSRINEALQRSNSFLKAQQEAAIDGILAVDENRSVTSYNLRFCQMWNIPIEADSANSLESKDVTDLLNCVIAQLAYPDSFSRNIEHLSEHPTALSQEVLNLRDGRIIEYYSSPVFSYEYQLYGRIWYFRDITEPQLAAEELKRSHKALSDIHYALEQAAIVAITNPEGAIFYVNDKFCEVCQYSREEILGKTHYQLVRSDHHPAEFFEDLWATIGRGTIWRGEIKNRAKDGSYYWVNTTVVPFLDERGKPFQHLSITFDITERKRAEEELQAFAAKLEVSNRELQDFAYVASHDLQEPLRKIQAFGDRLANKYGDRLNDQGRDYLTRMQNAAHRMQTLIQDLLLFSRVTTKAQPYSPIDLTQLTQEVLGDLEMRIEQTKGRVELHPLPTLNADPRQIRQLMQNLISNALKFHRPDVPPLVEISAQLLPENNPQICQLHVKDNGIGFEEKYLDRIFNIFQRLHGRTSYEGTGVGLAICRKIVERHGGNITANSQPGEGTTFTVTLPLKPSNS